MKFETQSKFAKDDMVKALSLLNDELEKSNITGEICIVGGAAMVLSFGSRRSTRDIDALMISPASVRLAAEKVAQENGMPPNWLNDGAKGFASHKTVETKELLQFSHLRVITPPAEYILAMKCMAARVGLDDHDKDDVKFLMRHLGLRGSESVLQIVGKYYDEKRIPAKTAFFVEEVSNELFSKSQDIG